MQLLIALRKIPQELEAIISILTSYQTYFVELRQEAAPYTNQQMIKEMLDAISILLSQFENIPDFEPTQPNAKVMPSLAALEKVMEDKPNFKSITGTFVHFHESLSRAVDDTNDLNAELNNFIYTRKQFASIPTSDSLVDALLEKYAVIYKNLYAFVTPLVNPNVKILITRFQEAFLVKNSMTIKNLVIEIKQKQPKNLIKLFPSLPRMIQDKKIGLMLYLQNALNEITSAIIRDYDSNQLNPYRDTINSMAKSLSPHFNKVKTYTENLRDFRAGDFRGAIPPHINQSKPRTLTLKPSLLSCPALNLVNATENAEQRDTSPPPQKENMAPAVTQYNPTSTCN